MAPRIRKLKKEVFGGDNPFGSVEEYADFARKHKVFGSEAHKLKKQLDKQISIPEPKIYGKRVNP